MKKEKIGILTIQNTVNFGAQLQAFALQHYLTKKGYETEIINYSQENTKIITNLIFKLKIFIKSLLLNLNMYKIWKKMYNLSKEIYNDNNISTSNKKYDIFLVGSDQVWNPIFCKKSNTYLLDFTSKYKISYAASFGVKNIEKKDFLRYKEFLSKLNYTSVREESGCNIYKKLTNKKSTLVVDPTFLLNKEDWSNYVDVNYNNNNNKYVLVYMLEYSKELINIGKKYAKKNNLKYKIISGTPRAFYIKGVQWNMSPQKFIKLFYNSDVVFTNSFHGTCFSLNFQKQVYIKLLEKNKKVNSRLTDLAKKMNIENRILDGADINNINAIKPIDYKKVNKKLSDIIQISMDFLNDALEKYNYEE